MTHDEDDRLVGGCLVYAVLLVASAALIVSMVVYLALGH